MTHKYMSQEIDDAERMATFAVREGILEIILDRLRADAGSDAINSFHIVGPRGAGKTTLLHMIRQHVAADVNLDKHYWPVILPEEQVAASSLRDFLSAILEQMKEDGSIAAAQWYDRCEAEQDDRASATIAEAGLVALAKSERKILLIGVENFDRVLTQILSESQERAVLRRLMIDRPSICLLATSTTLLETADQYDDPLFGHFMSIDLPTLGDKEAERLLQTYAKYRGDKGLEGRLRKSRGMVRSLNRLTGGNPRLLLMLYDVILLKKIDVAVDALQALIDEMTPLYNGLLDRLPAGPRKVLDTIMRAGGAAQPTNIAKAVRGMKLAEVTSHLRRLKQDGYVTNYKGGKGRPAYYTASDRFFGTWYRMRYLRAGKRPIELFVEFLQAWYTADERFSAFRSQLNAVEGNLSGAAKSRSGDYLLYSMSRTARFNDALSAVIDRGVAHGEAGDTAAEIADYARVIDMPDAPAEQRAIALVNRGVAHGKAGDAAAAIADCSRVIDMPDAPAEQRAMALVNRGVANGRAGDTAEAIADCSCVIDMLDAPAEQRARALVNRGIIHGQAGDAAAAIADYSRVIDMPDALAEQRARALFSRGRAHGRAGDATAEIADYSRVIDMPDAPAEQRVRAFFNRGVAHAQAGDTTAAIADYSRVIDMPDAPAEQRVRALVNRGFIHGQAGEAAAEVADYSRVIDMPDAPAEQRATALVNRGITHGQAGDAAAAIADYSRVIDMPDAPAEQRAMALVNRGVAHGRAGDAAAAIADCSRVIDMPDAPAEQRATALVNRGVARGQAGDAVAEIADYSCVIDMPNAPAEQRATAIVNRGVARGQAGDAVAEIADYSRVIDMPDAPAEQRATAIVYRGITHGQAGDAAAEIADYSRVIDMPDAPAEQRVRAIFNRGVAHAQAGDVSEAIEDWKHYVPRANRTQLVSDAVQFTRALAWHGLRDQWAKLLDVVIESLPEDLREGLFPFRLVANRLEGASEAEIDRQPPEVRDFALEILAGFDPPVPPSSSKSNV